MKTQLIQLLILPMLLFLAMETEAQTSTKKPATKSKTTKKKSTVTKSAPVPITVTLVSKCEKPVMIYSGPKTNLKDPKQRQVGGLSVNKLFLKTGDVVCIMDPKKKPLSCIDVTKTTLNLEINFSGTAILKP
jgi:hypothetical protein